jgi:hypothetical protein
MCLHWMLGQGKIGLDEPLDHVPTCFGGSAEVGRAFLPPHLQCMWDYDPHRAARVLWQDVTKIPSVLRFDDHAPEPVRQIDLS